MRDKIVLTILLFFHFHAKHQLGLNQASHLILQHSLAWPTKESNNSYQSLIIAFFVCVFFFSLGYSSDKTILITFNHVSVRFAGEYPASTSKHLNIIPSQDERNAFSRKELSLANVASLVKQASSASTYKQKRLYKHWLKDNRIVYGEVNMRAYCNFLHIFKIPTLLSMKRIFHICIIWGKASVCRGWNYIYILKRSVKTCIKL